MTTALVFAALVIGHSHNDYEQPRPFWDAFEAGLKSIEADVYLVDGDLLVAHNRQDVKPERNLESMYLAPMDKSLPKKGGYTLLVDIKEEGAKVLPVLIEQLGKHPSLFGRRGRCKVVISGDRPIEMIKADKSGLVTIDGRLEDLNDRSRAIAWISSDWEESFRWRGFGPFAADEAARLDGFVKAAHARKRLIRFWAAPDTPAAWQVLRDHGVDLIGTDKPAELGRWISAGS